MLLPGHAQAEIFEKVGTFGGQFLKIPVGARAAAMGGAYVAMADEASAVFWNAAGIARIDPNKSQLSATKKKSGAKPAKAATKKPTAKAEKPGKVDAKPRRTSAATRKASSPKKVGGSWAIVPRSARKTERPGERSPAVSRWRR